MGYLKYLKEAFRKPSEDAKAEQKARLVKMRKDPVTVRLERPTRLDRARAIGYKPKQGIVVVRQRVGRGGRNRPTIRRGRRPSRFHQRKNLNKNYQLVAEERAASKYRNCEVLGSYQVAQDGIYAWFEIILVDRRHPAVLKDKRYLGVAAQKDRAGRGLTSAGRKGRGLRSKGIGAEKIRPGLRAKKRRH